MPFDVRFSAMAAPIVQDGVASLIQTSGAQPTRCEWRDVEAFVYDALPQRIMFGEGTFPGLGDSWPVWA